MPKAKNRKVATSRKSSVTIQGIKTRRNEKMLARPYRLVNKNTKRVFVGSLIDTIN